MLDQRDYVGPGTLPLRFVRFYDSIGFFLPPGTDPARDGLGNKWQHSYQQSITLVHGQALSGLTIAYVLRPNGDYRHFTLTNGVWVGRADKPEKLVERVDGGDQQSGWAYTTADNHVERYDAAGTLLSITAPDGRALMMTYSDANTPAAIAPQAGLLIAVTDSFGRSLALRYNAQAKLVEMDDPAGNAYTYGYDAKTDLLATVTYPGGGVRTYLYDEPGHVDTSGTYGLLTGIVDENNQRFWTFEYGFEQRMIHEWSGSHRAKERTVNVYGAFNNPTSQTTITGPMGVQYTKYFVVNHGVIKNAGETRPCVDSGCSGSVSSSVSYDAAGYVASRTDFGGATTSYTTDPASGLVTQRVDADATPSARHVDTSWNAALRQPEQRSVKNASGVAQSMSRWSYNSRGQALALCKVDSAIAGAASYTCGAAATAPAGVRQTTFTYCEQADVDAGICPVLGLRLSLNGARNPASAGMNGADDITHYTYYPSDDSGCASSGACTHRRGDLWKKTDALGHVTVYLAYDGDGRVRQAKDANDTITDFTFSPRGWLVDRIVRANSDGTASANDSITRMDYDAVGNVTRVTAPDGSYLAYAYDAAHRLIKITDNLGNSIDYCPGGIGSVECLDAAGNRRAEMVKDPNGVIQRSVHRVYDQLSRLQKTLNAAQQSFFDATDGYDDNGNLVRSVDGRGVVTKQHYDALDRLIATIQDVGGTDPGTANATTHYGYDAVDQLRSVTDPSGLVTNYTYDGLGNLTQLDSPDTGTTTYQYDAGGNRISKTDARGVTVTYDYDALNRLVAMHYPDSTLDRTYAYGQPNSVTGCAASFPKGRLTRLTDSTGSTTWCYDRRGNPTDKAVKVDGYTIHMRYTYDLADHLTSVDNGGGSSLIAYGRDAAGRIDTVEASRYGVVTPLVTDVDYLPFGPAQTYTFASGATLNKTYDQDYHISDVVGSVAAPGDALNLHFATDPMATSPPWVRSPACQWPARVTATTQ